MAEHYQPLKIVAANLCQLCQSVPLHSLPPFPDGSYSRTLSGYQHLHNLVHDPDRHDPIPEPLGFRHHPDLDSLRRASTAGCQLCREIEVHADNLLADIARRKARYAQYPDVRLLPGDPSFDLWITKRGEGGDGFWVSTKSSTRPDKLLFPIATFGFCAENDNSSLATIFPGRPITGQPDTNVLDRVAGWVTACDIHENCTGHDSSLPTRIIDIGSPGSETAVRIVEPKTGARGKYTALSYCWGAASNPHVTNRPLLDARKIRMNVAGLPQTFQDAIAMTRRLGIRYIWIDSLCICQDDLKDWERESARMAAVYSNAYLTIAATGSSDPSGGLFFNRPGRPYLYTEYRSTGSRNSRDTGDAIEGRLLIFPLQISKEVVRFRCIEMENEPLTGRGWAFQERALARRVLHFASDQASLECLEGTVYEDGLRLPNRYYSIYQAPVSRIEGLTTSQQQDPAKKQWYALLGRYGNRRLTFPSDKLPALSGIAKVYGEILDDEYVAGIWRKAMIEGLCWQGLQCRAVERYRAPSWSWASVDGKVPTGFFGPHIEVATVRDYHVEIDGDNPFGRVKSAWIKIEGPLVPLFLSEKTGPTGHMRLKTGSGVGEGTIAGFDTIDRNYSVSAEFIRQMKLFALVLAARTGEGSELESKVQSYICLMVTPVEGNGDVAMLGPMKRVGWTCYSPEDFGPGVLESSKVTITLI